MFASEPVLVDPEPHLGDFDPAGLDWEAAWDRTTTLTADAGWDDCGGDVLEDALDVELRALLDSLRRSAPQTSPDGAAPLSRWTDTAIVAEAARLERLTRWATARGYELIHELASRRPAPSGHPDERGLSAYALDEVAVATGISRWAACRRVAEADALTRRHPALLAALSAGCLAPAAVQRVLDTTAVLDPAGCAVVEARLLDRAGRPVLANLGSASPEELAALSTEQVLAISTKATPAYVGRVTRDLVQQQDPAAAKRRETKAKTGRSVGLELAADGMAWLTAHLPAAAALAAYEHLDALAHTLPTQIHPDGDTDSAIDTRNMDAKRADVLTSLLLGATVSPEGTATPPAPIHVHVIVDARTTSRHDTTGMPAEASRLGPVSADTLRDLLDLTDHTAGAVDGAVAVDQPCPGTDIHQIEGPGPYQPADKLKNLLRVRHRTCVFPGCTRPSRACELDHTLPYPTGPTCTCNLAPLCIHHHHLKHQAPRWQLVNHGDGRLTWTTPTGTRIHVGDPDTDQGPAPPTTPDPDPPPDNPDNPDDPDDPDDLPPF